MSKGKGKNKSKRPRTDSSSTLNSSSVSQPPCCMCDTHKNVNKEIEELDSQVTSLKQTVETVKVDNDIQSILENMNDDIENLKIDKDRSPIPLLIDCVIKQNQQITKLTTELTDLKARSMRRNVLLHNVPEVDGDVQETPERLLLDHVKKMGLKGDGLDIERAHRMGPKRSPGSNPRPIVVAFTSTKTTDKVLKARPKFDRKKLKDKKLDNRSKDQWMSPHLPQEMLEERKRLNFLADHHQDTATKNKTSVKISIKLDKLRVNDNLTKPQVNAPGIEDMLALGNTDMQELSKYKFDQFDKISKENSSITGFRPTKALTSHHDLNEAYKSFMLKPGMLLQKTGLVYKLSGEKGFSSSGGSFGTFASMVLEEISEDNFCMFIVSNGTIENFRKESVKALVKKFKENV